VQYWNERCHNFVSLEVYNNVESLSWDEIKDTFVDNVMIDINSTMTGVVGEAILTNPTSQMLAELSAEGYVVENVGTWICVDGYDDDVTYWRVTEPTADDYINEKIIGDNMIADSDPIHRGRKLRAPSREYRRMMSEEHPDPLKFRHPGTCRRIKGYHNTEKQWKHEERRSRRYADKTICRSYIG